MTVSSPSQFPAICFQTGVTDQFYPTRTDLLWEIAGLIKAEITSLLAAGVPYVQIDAPRYSYYVEPRWRQHLRELGEDPDHTFEDAINADNMCLEGTRRSGATLAMHICRGNNQSKWYAEGGYVAIAERLFGSLDVDRFLLEYDTERAGTLNLSGICLLTKWLSWAWLAAKIRRWSLLNTCCSASRRRLLTCRWRILRSVPSAVSRPRRPAIC